MTFEPCISGIRVKDFRARRTFDEVISFTDLNRLPPDVAKWVVNAYVWHSIEEDGKRELKTWLDMDDIMKLSIAADYPDEMNELIDRFGENWLDYYIRFNH